MQLITPSRSRLARTFAIWATIVLITMGCGTGTTDQEAATGSLLPPTAETNDAVEPSSEPNVASPTPLATVTPEPGSTRFELAEVDTSDLAVWNAAVGGGVTFGAPQGASVLATGNLAEITGAGPAEPRVTIAIIDSSFGVQQLSIDEIFSFSGIGEATLAGETLSIGGVELERYSLRLRSDLNPDAPYPRFDSGAFPFGLGTISWGPFPASELFVAEVPRGIVAIGYQASSASMLGAARDLFSQIAPSIRFKEPLDSSRNEGPAEIGHPDPLPFPTEIDIDGPIHPIMPVHFQLEPVESGT